MDNDSGIDLDAERYAKIRERQKLAHQTFTPTRPVQIREIFSGRNQQLMDCLGIADTLGLHGILYGDRGVGKTSIANMVRLILDTGEEGPIVQKIECVSRDTFEGIVRQIYAHIPIQTVSDDIGFVPTQSIEHSTIADMLTEKSSFNPKDIATVFRQIGRPLVIILDEFDRLQSDNFDLSSFTELIKISSDTNLDLHFLVVGVGESVADIIGNHASIVRNLTQIKLGSMSDQEISDIIKRGVSQLNLTMPSDVSNEIVEFSCGYPHYTHLLCLDSSINAIRAERDLVEREDLDYAISRALSKAQESVKTSYHDATRANRQNIYKEVLHACGEAELDEFNTFVPKDIERHLSKLLKRPMKATQFGAHLINLCKPDRGAILTAIGERGRARYRFRDPLMRAYVRLATGPRHSAAND